VSRNLQYHRLLSGLLGACVVVAGVGAIVLWLHPGLLIASSSTHVSAADRLTAEGDARNSVAQLLAGVALGAGLVYTARTYRLTRQEQYTSRFTQSVGQLGSDSVAVRTGAVFAFQRLGRESSSDLPSIIELLAAFIRATAPWDDQAERHLPQPGALEFHIPYLLVRSNDVQGALTVLGRLGKPSPEVVVTLVGADLRRSFLNTVNFSGFSLNECHLEYAVLNGANLRDASLSDAHLEGAELYDADLTGAYVDGAHWATALINSRTRLPNPGFDWHAEGMFMVDDRSDNT
jgi:hypothetical protein